MPKSQCHFLIPTHYNDGTPVEPEKFIKIKTALDRQFGGYRILPASEGSWHGQVENTMEVVIAVSPKRIPELRNVVIAIGKELGQKAMYFNAPAPSVEIIDVETGTEERQEGDALGSEEA